MLLSKPSGGERAIALLALLVRVHGQMRRNVTRVWSAEWAQHWDKDVKGSSALRSALLQLVMVELDECRGLDWAAVLFHVAKLYDTRWVVLLIFEGLNMRYPAKILVLSCLTYLSPCLLVQDRVAVDFPRVGSRLGAQRP